MRCYPSFSVTWAYVGCLARSWLALLYSIKSKLIPTSKYPCWLASIIHEIWNTAYQRWWHRSLNSLISYYIEELSSEWWALKAKHKWCVGPNLYNTIDTKHFLCIFKNLINFFEKHYIKSCIFIFLVSLKVFSLTIIDKGGGSKYYQQSWDEANVWNNAAPLNAYSPWLQWGT